MDVLYYLVRRSRLTMSLAVISGMFAGFGSAALVGLINFSFDRSASGNVAVLLAYIGLGVAVVIAQSGAWISVARLGHRTAFELRTELSRRIVAAPLRSLQELGAPRLLANLTEDVTTLANSAQVVPTLCIQTACVLGCFIYLGWLSRELLGITAGTIVFGIGIYRLAALKGMRELRLVREQDGVLYSHFRALTQGIKELKLHRRRRESFLDDVLQVTARNSLRSNCSGATAFILASVCGTVLFYCLIGVVLFVTPLHWDISKEVLSGYTLTILYMMAPLSGVLQGAPVLGRASIALDKINVLREELDNRKLEMCLPHDKLSHVHSGSIEFTNVTHRYYSEGKHQSFLLGPINLAIKSGDLVFIVGGNGSGKTTLAMLLVGLYTPENGFLKFDGEVIGEINREYYRQHFSAVFSDFYLFDSLLGLFAGDLDDRAHAYLKRLQLDHKVSIVNGELSSLDLSQGQRKRLALLTAYLEDRPVYVFDEWAADQDPMFRELFYTVLLPELKAKGKTVVAITHDDRYFHLADRLIKLEFGKIVEDRRMRQESGVAHAGCG